MPGILQLNNDATDQAWSDYERSQLGAVEQQLYNRGVREANQQALGKIIASGGKAVAQTYGNAQQMYQQNQQTRADQAQDKQEIQDADPQNQGEANLAPIQDPSQQSGSLTASQYGQLSQGFFQSLFSGGGAGSTQ
jgi:hypothetical protein